MLSYIATNSTSDLIENICNKLDITILNKEIEKRIDFVKYIKQTKVNFNLINYFIIEISCLDNLEEEIIKSIYDFSRLYIRTRIIIIARKFDCQNKILTTLYEKGIYNIINKTEDKEVKQQIINALSKEGIQKKDAKQFKKIEEVKNNKFEKVRQLVINIVSKLKKHLKIDNSKLKNILKVWKENILYIFFRYHY